MSIASYAPQDAALAGGPASTRGARAERLVESSPSLECLHCATPLSAGGGERFCCAGCELVYALLHREQLERFYELRGGRGVPLFGLAGRAFDTKWLEPIEAVLARADGATRLDLDVQGLHCVGCVWLIDEVFRRQDGALSVVVNPALGKAQLTVTPRFALRAFVEKLARFGYLLGPSRKTDSPASSDLLLRLGISAALAMNSMIFAIALYAGLDGPLARLFHALELALSAATVAVGGPVFFRSAWQGLRRGILHFDLPIALGIVLAFAGSAWSFFARGSVSAYFDTLGVFVTLMLAGRFLQERVLERNRRALLASEGADGLLARRVRDEAVSVVPCTTIEKGDALLVAPGDLVPVAAELDAERGSFSFDWINGESRPRELAKGDVVPAGAFLAGTRAVTVRATEDFSASPLVELLRSPSARDGEAPRATPFWQRLARRYVLAVFAAAVGALAFTFTRTGDLARSFDVVTAVLVVTCPCAFGIATPLAYEIVQNGLRRAGLFVRSAGFLDRATQIRRVVFDKTGTLTTGTLEVTERAPLEALADDERDVLYNLAARSNHPKSQAVARALEGRARFSPSLAVDEEPGRGLSVVLGGREYRFGAPAWVGSAITGADLAFGGDGRLLAALATSEETRPDARSELARLRDAGYEVLVLSGDAEGRVKALATSVGIDPAHAFGARSASEKAAFVRAIDRCDTLMIGDGINDSLVVGEAFASGTPAIDRPFMAARSDFYFVTPGLRPIRLALESSRLLARVVRQNLAIALSYNAIAVSLAFAGLMSPLLCAVLMPASSIATVLATVVRVGTRSAPWRS